MVPGTNDEGVTPPPPVASPVKMGEPVADNNGSVDGTAAGGGGGGLLPRLPSAIPKSVAEEEGNGNSTASNSESNSHKSTSSSSSRTCEGGDSSSSPAAPLAPRAGEDDQEELDYASSSGSSSYGCKSRKGSTRDSRRASSSVATGVIPPYTQTSTAATVAVTIAESRRMSHDSNVSSASMGSSGWLRSSEIATAAAATAVVDGMSTVGDVVAGMEGGVEGQKSRYSRGVMGAGETKEDGMVMKENDMHSEAGSDMPPERSSSITSGMRESLCVVVF